MVKEEAQSDIEFGECEEESDELFFECVEKFESPLKSNTNWLAVFLVEYYQLGEPVNLACQEQST